MKKWAKFFGFNFNKYIYVEANISQKIRKEKDQTFAVNSSTLCATFPTSNSISALRCRTSFIKKEVTSGAG